MSLCLKGFSMFETTAGILTATGTWDTGYDCEVPKFEFWPEIREVAEGLFPSDLCERVFDREVNPWVAVGWLCQSCQKVEGSELLLSKLISFVTHPEFPTCDLAPADHPTWADSLMWEANSAADVLERLHVYSESEFSAAVSLAYLDRSRVKAALAAYSMATAASSRHSDVTFERMAFLAKYLDAYWEKSHLLPEWSDAVQERCGDLIAWFAR